MANTAFTFRAIRDCGYGSVWTRLAIDREDALATVASWKHEGRSDGFINGGDYFVQPIHEYPNDIGGFSSEPMGEREPA